MDATDRPTPSARVGALLTSASSLAAIGYFFGWRQDSEMLRHFGLQPTDVGRTPTDYLLRTASLLYVALPAVAVAAVVLVGLVVQAVLRRRAPDRLPAPVLLWAGLAVLVAGVLVSLVGDLRDASVSLAGPLLVLAGLALARVGWPRAAPDWVTPQAAGWAAVAAGLAGVLWLTSAYAAVRGRAIAERYASHPDSLPAVVLYSDEPIAQLLGGPGRLGAEFLDGKRYYKYDEIRLLAAGNGKWFLVPREWRTGRGLVAVVPESDHARMIVVAPGGGS